jgi:hypothetical protein
MCCTVICDRITIQVFYVKEVSGTHSGLTLAEACGEALRQGLRSAWVGSKLHVPVGIYALVTPIILEKDLEIEGACLKDTVIHNCVPMRCDLHFHALRSWN